MNAPQDRGLSVAAAALELLVRQVRLEATGIHSYELVRADGGELPRFSAGAHIDVHVAPGIVRQYSLCNDPAERHRYVIAVLREAQGRGGSRALHATAHAGERLTVSAPRNHFELVDDAARVLLLAGGIGITPLKAMSHRLEALGIAHALHYCAKGPDFAAFGDALAAKAARGELIYHFDGGVPGKGLDIAGLLAPHAEGTHLYYCGPSGFMEACRAASAHWPAGTVHCEHFSAPVTTRRDGEGLAPGAFVARIASTGQRIEIGATDNFAEALQSAGCQLETSCQSGLCGTCKTRYLSGDIDHQDYILDDAERAEYLTPCVSRARGGEVVLDL